MNDDRALEQRFLDRAKALSNVAEVFRCSKVTLLICDMVAFGVRAVYRARFFGHKFDLSGVLHVGFLPGETRLARAA